MAHILYFLYGSDSYLIRKQTEAILDEHHIDRLNMESYDMEEVSLVQAIDSAMTIPFFEDKKAVVLTNCVFLSASKSPKDLEQPLEILEEYVRNPNPSTIFIVQAPYEKLERHSATLKALMDHAEPIVCAIEQNEDIFVEVKNILSSVNLRIEANALQLFVSRVGSDRLMMKNELDKLIAYSAGMDTITMDTVRTVVYKNPEDHIYLLVNAVIAEDKQMMIQIYQELLQANLEPMWLLGAIVSKFQEILYTKELLKTGSKYEDIMKYFSASKGRTYYIMKNANDISEKQLLDYLNRLEKLDSNIKTGQIDKEVGIELFLMQIYQ